MGSILTSRAAMLAAIVALSLARVTSAAAQHDPVAPETAAVGPVGAPYVLTVYSDFACGPCGHLAAVLETLVESAPQRVRIVFKHAPTGASRGRAAHLAAAAAARQGRFWEMHNVLFSNQDRLAAADIVGMAAQIGLDMDRFRSALASPEVAAAVDADIAEATRFAVTGRPHILINGAPFPEPATLEQLRRATGGS